MTNGILNSWKDIATYVGRGVRTVQRWERDLNFPVFRTNDRLRGSVFAYRAQIDEWFHGRLDRAHIDGVTASRPASATNGNDANVCPMCEGSGRLRHPASMNGTALDDTPRAEAEMDS